MVIKNIMKNFVFLDLLFYNNLKKKKKKGTIFGVSLMSQILQ